MGRLKPCFFVCVGLFSLSLCLPRSASAVWPTDPAVNVPLCTTTGDQWRPRVVSDGAGGAVACWTDKRNGTDTDIYAQRISYQGAPLWSTNGVALCTAAGDQRDQSIAPDGAGGAIVAWHDNRGGTWKIYAQRVNSTGAPLWATDGVAVCTVSGNPTHSYPHVVADSAGGAIIVWVDARSGGADVYAQRLNASGVPQWSPDGAAVCTSPVNDQELDVVADGAGGGFVTWESRSNLYGDVYAQWIDASGVCQWSGGVLVRRREVGGSGNSGASPVVVVDGAGGALVAWGDKRNGDDQVFAQRLSASGVPLWTTGGVPLSPTAPNSSDISMISDLSGGAVLGWIDDRTGSFMMHAQRVNGAGTALWTSSGVGLSAGYGLVDCGGDPDSCNWMPPCVVLDGSGGAIGSWWGTASNDIYAQRVDASGALKWGTNGSALCTASGDQVLPALASDGGGGVIAVWEDHRNGNWDIYAQQAGPNGQLGTADVAPGETLAFALDPVRPNPSRGGALTIHFSVPTEAPARLDLLDVAGRLIASHEVGVGQHTLDLGAGRHLRPGLYLVRLTQGANTRTTRVAVLR